MPGLPGLLPQDEKRRRGEAQKAQGEHQDGEAVRAVHREYPSCFGMQGAALAPDTGPSWGAVVIEQEPGDNQQGDAQVAQKRHGWTLPFTLVALATL